MNRLHYLNLNFSWIFRKSVLLLVSSIVIVTILNSNFQMGLLKENLLSLNSKIVIFLVYVMTFTLTSLCIAPVDEKNLKCQA